MKKNCLFILLAALAFSATVAFGTTVAYTNVVVGDHPVSFWPLNETSGTVIYDLVGANNGTVMNAGGLTLGGPGILYSNGVTADTAIYFTNSASGYISVPYSSTLNTPSFTVEAWLKMPVFPVGTLPDMNPITFESFSQPWGWAWEISNPNSGTSDVMQGWIAKTGGGWSQNNCGKPIQGGWSYYVMTYNAASQNFSIYTNGVLATSATTTYQMLTTPFPLYIGAYNNGSPARFYSGGMENVAIYSNALSSVQIATHYYYGTNSGAPLINTQPLSQTNYTAQTATFTVNASGLQPLAYQWQAGVTGSGTYTNLNAGGQFSGVTNATLSINNLVLGNAADYLVVIANSYGSITSSVARLTVVNNAPNPPSINTPPKSQTNYVGLASTFTVNASGFVPLTYQWRAGVTGSGVYTNLPVGSQITAVTNTSLTLSNLVFGNAADYVAVVTNAYGSITSAVATLTVLSNPTPMTYDALVLYDHPVSYWPMQETSGSIVQDIISGNNGQMERGSVPYASNNFASYRAWTNDDGSSFGLGGPGILHNVPNDKAIYFTNKNATFIAVPYAANLNSAKFTTEVWLHIPNFPINPQYPLPATETFALMDFMYNGDQPTYGWEMDVGDAEYQDVDAYQAGLVNCWMGKADGSDWAMSNNSQQFNNQWIYATLSYDGTSLRLYIDGVVITTITQGYGQPLASESGTIMLLMGAEPAREPPIFLGWFYQGGMSHAAYYNYALSTSQITNHYFMATQGGVLPPSPTPTLSAQRSGGNLSVSWANGFLQQAGSPGGPWTDVLPTNQPSPYVTGPSSPSRYFRASTMP